MSGGTLPERLSCLSYWLYGLAPQAGFEPGLKAHTGLFLVIDASGVTWKVSLEEGLRTLAPNPQSD